MKEWASAPRWRPRYLGVSTTPSRSGALVSRYVGVDLHRRRCWVVVLDGDGQVVSSVNVDNRALLATLAYRLFQFWLPIPAGLVAYFLFRRKYGKPSELPAVS